MTTEKKEPKPIYDQIIDIYRPMVENKHPDLMSAWPVLSGFNVRIGSYKSWTIVIMIHTGASGFKNINGIGEISTAIIGVEEINENNKDAVRRRIEKHFKVDSWDAVILLDKDFNSGNDFLLMLQKHEFSMGVVPMRIFLSHKGVDKALIREFKSTLELLGYSPWLDEDAMSAGSELERSILQGFTDSCAAIFFITPSYKDENYLATEVDYAIQEKRKKGEKFSIITLVFNDGDKKGVVPSLLHRYVWKEPLNHLEALREIIKALPVQTGEVYWK